MKKMETTAEKKVINLLKILLENNNRVLTEKIISLEKCSFAELQGVVEELNDALRKIGCINYDGKYLELAVNDNLLFYEFLIEKWNVSLFNKRQIQIITELIKVKKNGNNSYVQLNSLANKLFLSRSTVNNEINQLRKNLELFSVKIEGKTNHGVSLAANEFQLRLLMIHLPGLVDYSREFQKMKNDFFLMNIIKKIEEKFLLEESKKLLLRKAIIITNLRCSSGNHLNDKIPVYNNFFSDDNEFIKLKKYLCSKYITSMTEEDFNWLCFPINMENTKRVECLSEYNIKKLLNEMINSIYEEYMFYLDKGLLDSEIINHIIFLLNRTVFKIMPSIVSDEQIKKSFPFAYQISKSATNVLEKQFCLKINNQEISFLALYFQLAIQTKYDAPKKFAVLKSTRRSALKLIENKIRSLFYKGCEFIEIDESQILKLDSNSVLAIISNEWTNYSNDIPVIMISNIFSQNYVENIINLSEKKQLLKNKNIIGSYSEIYMTNFDFNKCIREILFDVSSNNQITKDFIFDIKDSKIKSISNGNCFFPHAILEGSRFLFSVDVIRTKEIKQNGYYLFFLLGVPSCMNSEREILLLKIYDYIFEKINKFNKLSTVDQHNFVKQISEEIIYEY